MGSYVVMMQRNFVVVPLKSLFANYPLDVSDLEGPHISTKSLGVFAEFY